mgnify:CR=1 FL=1
MGNNDGIMEALINLSKNEVISFNGGYFSYALGEIALVIDEKYFILNCDEKLWKKVNNQISALTDKATSIKFLKEQSKLYEISVWSKNFVELK